MSHASTAAALGSERSGAVRVGGPRSHEEAITSRLRKVAGQVAGVRAMHEQGRYCIDVLDQLAAARAAIDGIALLVLEDHINACVRQALVSGQTEEKIPELVAAVRRYVRTV
jgi:DNA-binding FrmR family transcriptional regulator